MGLPHFGTCLCIYLLFNIVASDTVNVPLQDVPAALVQHALKFLNSESPTQHIYKGGNLISAQKLIEQPHTVYRLTLDLEPICEKDVKPCPREACAIDIQQQELGSVDVKSSSIQCMYLYPQTTEDETEDNMQDQSTIIENLEKQMINPSVQLDHEVQKTSDQNDRPFIAVRASSMQYCPGCPYELKPTLPGLAAFGEDIVNSIDQYGTSDYKHKVVEIVRVVRLVPPGSNVVRYELLLEIGESNCLRSSLIERSKCFLQPNTPIKMCLVTIDERPWQQPKNRMIVKNNCTESTDMVNELNVSNFEESSSMNEEDESLKITRSDIYEYDQIAQEGKLSTYASPADPQFSGPSVGTIKENGDESVAVSQQDEVTNIPVSKQSFVQVILSRDSEEKPPTFTDKYKEFDEFIKDFDIPIKNVTTSAPDNKTPIVEKEIRPIIIPSIDSTTATKTEKTGEITVSRTKRQLIGLSKQERILIRKLAQIVVEILDDIDSDNHKRIVLDVLEAKKETDDEFMYNLTIKVGSTHCAEKEALDRDCMTSLIGPAKICKVQVKIDQERLLRRPNVTNSQCFDENLELSRNKRSLVEAPKVTDPKDPEIQQFAFLGFQQFSKYFEGPNEPILIEVTEATVQTVSGKLYKIKVKLGMSDCPKGIKENCKLSSDSEVKECLVTLWSQPWKNQGLPLINVTCNANNRAKRSLRGQNYNLKMLEQAKTDKENPESSIKKRTLVGAPGATDPKDPEIQQFALLGFQKFSKNFEGPNEPILIEVTEATVQIVSGKLYKIKVKLGMSDCPKGVKENCQLSSNSDVKECLVIVWSQPWKDQGSPQVNVTCNLNDRAKRSLRGQNYNLKMLDQAEILRDERMFNEFQKIHKKVYKSEDERKYRFKIFRENVKKIRQLQETEQGTGRYGLTFFIDLTTEEFKKYTGLKTSEIENTIPLPEAKIPDIELPKEFDWRHHNVVTPVKNQGQCGSCWAFSVTGNVEGQYAIKHAKLLSLSEQELVDCDKLDDGCNGGLQNSAYEAIENLGGLELEKDYPYEAEDEKCHFNKKLAKVKVVSALNITSNETQMAQWLVKNGPIAIGINANAMQFYVGGISHPFRFLCNPKDLDHGVLIVGYGLRKYPIFKKTLPYWIIKNSWGSDWGEQGYYRVYRGDGTCGVNQTPTSSVVA